MSTSYQPSTIAPQKRYDCRDAYSSVLESLAEEDRRICAVVNDSVSSTKLKSFGGKFPDRFINVGIAEQNMIGVGAGLANGGMLPYVCGASCFLTARAMEQVKVDLGYSNSNVKLCGMSSGMAYGQLGPTHHSIEDLAWTRIIPNLAVVVPADAIETAAVMRYSYQHVGPMFLRISRMPVPNVHPEDFQFTFGKATILCPGDDITLIANGVLVSRALAAAEMLSRQGIRARVINMSCVKPIDVDAILDAARTTRGIVTVEEALATGGLGGAVAEVLAQNHPAPMRILGVPGVFAPTGTAEFLLDHFGLNEQGIVAAALDLLGSCN
ncbi:MAG: transketolase family protein [Acidobacteriaceae bacterium]